MAESGGGNNNNNPSKRMADESPTNWRSYMSAKKAKLKDQFEEDTENFENSNDGLESKSSLFAGMTIHTNGCAHPSNEQLRELIAKHGGKHDFYYSKQTTTHIVTETLTFAKRKTFANCIVVKPAWILESIAAGKVLPCQIYSIFNASHRPYSKGERQISDDENDDHDEDEDLDDEFPDIELDSERDGQGNSSTTLKAGDPGFLTEFFSKSRLHHLSTAGNDFKAYIQDKRANPPVEFVGKQRLKRYVKEMGLKSRSEWSGPVIMHIDMDCFFVSVGLLNKPLLRDKPVVVAHAKTGKGEQRPDQPSDQFNSFSELASCNYAARHYGIKNGMLLGKAKKLCPHVNIIPYDFEEYDRVSRILYDQVSSITLQIEAVSCDEMFVDITEVLHDAECEPKVFAECIRNWVKLNTACNASVGIGPNVLIAKLASKAAKPDNYVIVPPEKVSQFMADKPIQQLPGIGYSIASKLAEKFSADSCGHLSHIACERLQEVFGKVMGEKIYSMCRGIDRSDLKYDQASARKSVSVEVNYGIRFNELSPLEAFIHELADETSNRLKKIKAKGKCLTLKIKVRRQDAPVQTAKFMGHGICDNISRSTLLSFPTDSQQLIGKSIFNIFQSMNVHVPDLRGIAIQVTKLVSEKPADCSIPEKANSIQRFLLTSKPEKLAAVADNRNASSDPVPAARVQPLPQPTSLAEIDPDFLEALPEELRHEITSSFTSTGSCHYSMQSNGNDSLSVSKTQGKKKGKRSPKKNAKAAPAAQKPITGPLDRMFRPVSESDDASAERKVARIMNRQASFCGETDIEKIKPILTEWVSTEDVLHDEDVAYVTKFIMDLISYSKWATLKQSLAVLHE